MSRELRNLEAKGARQEARRQRLGGARQSAAQWYRGVRDPSKGRIGNLSGEAFITNDRRMAQSFGKVSALSSRGRFFSHDHAAMHRVLPRKMREKLKGQSSAGLGALYSTDHKMRRELRRRGFAGVEWNHQGAKVRYVFDAEHTLRRGQVGRR